ncbi:hypothetical protein ASD08_46830 [Streptomyces sp. Root369]|nr:hypothetical protein ASD08_46830 [Streptomyces sp. Root369]
MGGALFPTCPAEVPGGFDGDQDAEPTTVPARLRLEPSGPPMTGDRPRLHRFAEDTPGAVTAGAVPTVEILFSR